MSSRASPEALVHGLLALAQSLTAHTSFGARMNELCRLSRELLGCDRSSLFLLEERYYCARFNAGNPPDIAANFSKFRVRTDDALIAAAVARRGCVVVNDTAQSALMNRETAARARIRAIVVAPLIDETEQPSGFITAEFNEQPGAFDVLDSTLLLGIANLAAAAWKAERDLMAREREAQERSRLQERIHDLERLESLGRLAGGVAHDFNNLLTIILGYGELLMRNTTGTHRKYLEDMMDAGMRAAQLTSQLLAFGRRQILAPTDIALNDALVEMQGMLHRVLPSNIRITLTLGTDVGFVRIDSGELQRAILNLVLNARDAMPDGGELTLTTRAVRIDAAFCADAVELQPGEYSVFEVRDTGMGMDEEIAKRVFEPFFTTKSVGKGTGLGLSTVHGIVHQSAGFIRVKSTPGRGTAFEIGMPRMAPSRVRAVSEPAPAPGGGQEAVLVIDDDERVRRLIATSLLEHGYRVLQAESPAAALALPNADLALLELLIVDVVMPDMNGRKLVTELAARGCTAAALFISGHADDFIVRQGVLDEGLALLKKPFTQSQLLAQVRGALDLRHALQPGG